MSDLDPAEVDVVAKELAARELTWLGHNRERALQKIGDGWKAQRGTAKHVIRALDAHRSAK